VRVDEVVRFLDVERRSGGQIVRFSGVLCGIYEGRCDDICGR